MPAAPFDDEYYMATLPIGGLATGIDTEQLISKLLAVERQPITLFETRKVKLQAQATAFKDLNAKLLTLKTRVAALSNPDAVLPRSVTSSVDSVATATAGAGNTQGTFTLTTSALARNAIASAASTVSALTSTVASGPGTFEFRLGPTGAVVSVALTASTTLNDLVKAINDASAGVQATAVNLGTTASPAFKLTLASTATGAANDIVMVNDGTTLGVTTTQTGIDAAFTIAGIGSFTRSTNTFSDVIDGVTITLKASSGTTDLVVAADKGALQARVQAMIDGYNDVIRTIDGNLSSGKDEKGLPKPGAFTGDAVPQQLRRTLANAIGGRGPGTLKGLVDLGIKTEKDGTLTLDATKFQAAAADPKAVSDLLAGTSTKDGIADVLEDALEVATKALTGTIAARQDGITSTIKSVQQQIDRSLARLETSEKLLRARFVTLEITMSKLQSSGEFLTQQLSALKSLQTSS
jgi:flagellar hook-associated protein 2